MRLNTVCKVFSLICMFGCVLRQQKYATRSRIVGAVLGKNIPKAAPTMRRFRAKEARPCRPAQGLPQPSACKRSNTN